MGVLVYSVSRINIQLVHFVDDSLSAILYYSLVHTNNRHRDSSEASRLNVS